MQPDPGSKSSLASSSEMLAAEPVKSGSIGLSTTQHPVLASAKQPEPTFMGFTTVMLGAALCRAVAIATFFSFLFILML